MKCNYAGAFLKERREVCWRSKAVAGTWLSLSFTLWKNKHWCLYRLASLNSCVVKNLQKEYERICAKKKGKGGTFCKDVFLVCELASSDKPSLVNWLVDGELHWLENIIKKWLLCLHAAQYASLYAAARCHCTAWGHLVILPRRSSVKPPVQETRKFGRFNTWAWQCRRYPALAGHAEEGRDTLWYHECKL